MEFVHFFVEYAPQGENVIDCIDGQDYSEQLEKKVDSCKFDYKEIFANTSCTDANHYGYGSNKVCVLIKLNKIVSWIPESAEKRVKITCAGEVSKILSNLF